MTAVLDPDVTAVAKALYGDGVDPRDLAKSVDAADVHINGPIRRAPKPKGKRTRVVAVRKDAGSDPNAPSGKKKLLAGGLLAGAAIEGLAAKDTIEPLKAALKVARPAIADARGVGAKVQAAKPLVGSTVERNIPFANKIIKVPQRGAGTSAALQAGNFGVGLGAAKELTSTKKKPVSKAVILRIRPVNGAAVRRPVSLKARRPSGSPAVSKSFDAEVEISKVDADKRQVFGWANVSKVNGEVVRDRQGDEIDIEELEKAAYNYMLHSRIGGDQHARVSKSFDGVPKHTSDVIESMVFTDEKCKALGLPDDFTRGWFLGLQVNDEPTWELIKQGKRTGFSVHGTGRREPLEKSDRGDRKAERAGLKTRASQAAHPPAVTRVPVKSSAVRSLGYQPQTRRLSVQMVSRDEPYVYKVKPKTALEVVHADSKGKAYNQVIRNKARRSNRVGPVGRARLFAHPDQGVSKSEVKPGKFAPVTSLSSGQRQHVRVTSMTRTPLGLDAPTAKHGASAVYAGHAFGMSSRGPAALLAEKTTPSGTHPNIHYGSSVPARHHAALDAKINPALAARSPHPIVIHQDRMPEMIGAGAAKAHTVTGGKGHIVLNTRVLRHNGEMSHRQSAFGSKIKGHQVINHEIAHASSKETNPRKLFTGSDERAMHRNMGEEARADALSQKGKGLYQKVGAVAGKRDVRDGLRMTPKRMKRTFADMGMAESFVPNKKDMKRASAATRTAAARMQHYHNVRGIVRGLSR